MTKPNILLITDDQHRWDFMLNAGPARTPSLNRLASEGVTLDNVYSNCPICMPTRFTWLHGLYASQASAGLLDNAGDWPGHLPTVAQALQKEGYYTALIGKLHSLGGLHHRDVVSFEGQTLKRGFHYAFEVGGKSLSYWYDCRWTRHLRHKGLLERYRQDVASRTAMIGGTERHEPSFLSSEDHVDGFIGKHALSWLENYSESRPFFLHASFCGPHFPLDPSPEYFEHHRPEDMPPPVASRNRDGQILEDGEGDSRSKWQEHRALYCGLIEQVDREIGKILDLLVKKGWQRNTLVIFTTDHGDMIGDLGYNHKGLAFDAACRTPVIVRFPGSQTPSPIAGPVISGPAEAVDLPCAILDAAGAGDKTAQYLPGTPGVSWLGYARGDNPQPRAWAYSECRQGMAAWRMCREPDWKYVFKANGDDMLFDMREDPHEQLNLAGLPEHKDRTSRMRRQLVHRMTGAMAPASAFGPGSLSRDDL